MKTKHLLMTLLLALLVPWAAQAQQTHTVYENGTGFNNYIPVYGYSGDTQGCTSEFIIPATDLNDIAGGTISGLTFYVATAASEAWTATFNVYMKEVEGTTLSSNYGPNACTVVYTGALDATGTTMTVTFDQNYTYEGGNLLIGTYIAYAGNWKDATFSGISAEGAAYQSGGYQGEQGSQNFIPTTTFTYTPDANYCGKPANVHIVENTLGPREVAIEWDAESGELFQISMQATSSFDPNNIHWSGASTSHFEEWDRLTPDTDYTFCVRKKCGTDSYSQPVFLEFRTTVACPAPTLTLVANSETARGATLNWTGFSDSYILQMGSIASTQTQTILSEGFESGSLPTGWTTTGSYWQITSGTGHSSYTGSATGSYNAGCFIGSYSGSDILVTPAMDLSTALSATLDFNFWNTSWSGDINTLNVYYRVDEGDWNLLYTNSSQTSSWIAVPTITLEGLAANYQIGFECESNYSYGMGIDDVQVNAEVVGFEWITFDNNATSPYTFNTLLPETTYYTRVIGNCGSDGQSQPSNMVSFTTLASCPVPQNLAVTTDGATATATWTGTEGTCNISINGTVTNNVTSPYEFDVELSTTYEVKVQSNCDGGESSGWTDPVSFTTPVCIGGHEIEYTLTDSYNDGWEGAIITVIEACGDVVATLTVASGESPKTGTLTLCGDYYEFVYTQGDYPSEYGWTFTEGGTTIFSGGGNSSSDGQVLYTIGTTVAVPTDLANGEPNKHNVELSWTENGTATAWQICVNGDEDNLIDVTENPYILTGLDSETNYTVKIRAYIDDATQSCWSEEISFTTALGCARPTNVAAELQAYNAYNITWEGESDTYTLRYRTAEVTEGGFSDDFENGLFKWNVIDADGDGYGWVLASESPGIYHNQTANLTGSGHNGSNDMLLSASYSNITGVLTPDNYLVTPKVELGETFSFWAQAQDASYAAEHFGVAVSIASNNNPDDFTMVQEWTLTAKGAGEKANPAATRSGENLRGGNWYQFSVNLSDYAGEEGYIAIRHFNCTDQFIINVDDVVYGESIVVAPAGEWVVIENIANKQYLLEGLEEETAYEFQMLGVCEGDPSAWTVSSFFTTFADEPIGVLDGGYWEDPNTWLEGQQPEVNDPVAIIGDVIIGGDLTANGEITIAEGASLTVEPGVVVNAGDITIAEGASMTIQEGAVFNANEITVTSPDQLILQPNVEFTHNTEVPATLTFGYTASNAKDGEYGIYRLIASPITPYVTVNSTGLVPESTDANYQYVDLYYFDQSRSADDVNGTNGAWINYKQVDNMFVTFDLKKGYLYANGQNALGLFAGQTLPTSGIEVYVDLDYTDGNTFAGWNLVGNPFTCTTYITNGTTAVPYYVLNADGTDFEAKEAGTALAPMRGAFVQASATGQRAYFTTTQPSRGTSLGIMLNQGHGMIDNAYINFGGGNTLEKFQLNPSHTKIYMTIDGKDYAVTNAESVGEMPVSFKAEKNGTYSLGFNTENVEFSYLHLIDNLTGNDVDLLAIPSYSFEAQTTDYASRFKLVFATGSNDDNFAFFNNGNIIVNNEGEATLQVMDVNGRIIRSESINGTASIKMNAAAGVYMLRLINGNDVKVQKMIVK